MNEWDYKALEWPIKPESTVIECGAFHGNWALGIMQLANPTLHMFEPQLWLGPELQCTFKGWPKAHVHMFGLGTETKQARLWEVGNDGATFVSNADARDEGQVFEMREIKQAFDEIGLGAIDLMLMNIEGGEFTLIPHMFQQGIFPKWFMVQMHLKFGNEKDLRETLFKEYRLLWDYGSILTAWERREQ